MKNLPETASTSWILNQWVNQEQGRFLEVLIERGFLNAKNREDQKRISDALFEWRGTYISYLGIEEKIWYRMKIDPSREHVGDWFLGGWKDWLAYRPRGSSATTFNDVVNKIDAGDPAINQHHLTLIPEMARKIQTLDHSNSLFFLFHSEDRVAVLEGTHRTSAIAYAIRHRLPLPKNITVYFCRIPKETFDRFCEGRLAVL